MCLGHCDLPLEAVLRGICEGEDEREYLVWALGCDFVELEWLSLMSMMYLNI